MSDAKGLTRQQMCDRLAMEFADGWVVNLGIGIPTLCSPHSQRPHRRHRARRL